MLEDLDQHMPVRASNFTCKVRDLLGELEAKDADILAAALADDRKWSINGLHTALLAKGVDIGYQSLRRHRFGLCSCKANNA